MNVDKNKQLYLDFVKRVFEEGQLDGLSDVLGPDYHRHDPTFPMSGRRSHDQFRALVEELRGGLSDLKYDVDKIIGEGDFIAARWTITGKHTGRLFGHAETGRTIVTTGLSMNHVASGRFLQSWIQWDLIGLLAQLRGA